MPARRAAVSWRSGLEAKTAEDLTSRGVPFRYEEVKLRYIQPETPHTYTPDFILPNGVIVETKGLFDVDDRKKHAWLKGQHPDLDVRFVFSRSKSPLRKGAKSTYADWCLKNGFQFADKSIPQAWIDEPADERRLAAIDVASA
ncbi:hypothetical protein [Novosphingobium panipatense]|uniref:Phage endonuclease I n=1 Tax=Novosphingobium panipatense TaxID=428991 RepID=A0ABY1QN44_9SPHN|nr:hypothetical protein [Novosphingobium panipatense]SMP74121.1 Phage endonuclease I [Novosphingobium panipatense]